VKRAAHFIKINDLACGDNAVIPVVARPTVQALNNKLQARISGWDSNLWNIEEWYKDA
jgi:peptide/nickel transport system substrate-binding protein